MRILALALTLLSITSLFAKDAPLTHLNNPELTTIHPSFPGTPIHEGKFQNLQTREQPGFMQLMKWGFQKFRTQNAKNADTLRPKFQALTSAQVEAMRGVIWLGHSSLLIQTDSVSILIDPVQSFPFSRRYSELPISFERIPHVDYLLVSHGHLDHLDSKVAKSLDGDRLTALVPLKMGSVLKSANPKMRIQEAGWWQKFKIKDADVEIVLLPAQHWHRRGIADQDEILWGAFWIRINGVTIFYSGDTAYGPHFQEIRKIMGDVDVAILPIGAYRPDYIMKASHMTPLEAVQAFHDLGAKVFLPCHWGTFDLSDEPPGEPIQWLRQIASQGNLQGRLIEMGIGHAVSWQELSSYRRNGTGSE